MRTGCADGIRFTALDSLRGLSALLVVLFHFHGPGLLGTLAIVRNGWLFVDLFFVLSGFVLAHGHAARLAAGDSIGRFLALRLARIYPLHAVVLFAYLAAMLAAGQTLAPPRSAGQFVEALALLHSAGAAPNHWSLPSWSIAAEWWCYLLFALICARGGRATPWLFAAMAAAGLAVVARAAPHWLNSSNDFGLFRGMAGFGLGVLARMGFGRWRLGGTGAEIAVTMLAAAFVIHAGAGPLTLAAPLVFVPVILVFARGQGRVSALLTHPGFVRLGVLSYGIYMVHPLVQGRVYDLLDLIGGGRWTATDATGAQMLVLPGWAADAVTLAMLAAVVAVAAIAHHLVEQPARRWAGRWLAGQRGFSAVAARGRG
ncbi:acyltransferase family protein [Sphingomonas changnyeongensis]|uniref:Acyltransferase family protein n=1 Tax=Sphingomonas changnyeongensis TaxID=2698679 RepID=A0A7Z2S8T2_9SPHN|nr:acyltransferase [Sphingomonas changnyeongensis]QHL90134.1 acyltransferase family protein [Sphingomonas changnyeongensis]